MTSFVYSPLPQAGGYIRLADIQPAATQSAPIRCNLTETKIGDCPTYEALSYTWGSREPKASIRINDQDFETLQGLEAALRRLRNTRRIRTFWIDALCINQADKEERASQVSVMDQIYKNASQVVIWLGEPEGGDRSAMVSLATKNFSIANNMRMMRVQRKHGTYRGYRAGKAALLAGELDRNIMALEVEIGQVAQLLDRPWWRRVWIVQEMVLAQKLIIKCGSDEVPWDNVKMRLRSDGIYGLKSLERLYGILNEHGVVSRYKWPDYEHSLLDSMRSSWKSGTWNSNLYDLLYRFRQFECSNPRDHVFAFLGLVGAEQRTDIKPDYGSSVTDVYLRTARALIASHKHLILLNCRREYYQDGLPYRSTRLYSTIDQGRFLDPNATVLDDPNGKPRQGWIRLPDNWERVVDDDGTWFYDRESGNKQRESPLKGQILPSQTVECFRYVPAGWKKDWDNLGRVKYDYGPPKAANTKTEDLPSWVPDWNSYSARDPEPLPNLSDPEPCYSASGKLEAQLTAMSEAHPRILGIKGVLFDTVKTIAQPWCPGSESLPVSRSGVKVLEEWEDLALTEIEDCPYRTRGGRYNAFWRTHIADYHGENSMPEESKAIFEAWRDRTGWKPKDSGEQPKRFTSMSEAVQNNTTQLMGDMAQHTVLQKQDTNLPEAEITRFRDIPGYVKDVFKHYWTAHTDTIQRYPQFQSKIHRASINRAMFTTTKGYLGLAPWNAKVGDNVVVFPGGCTPFLLRTDDGEHFTLVGETYVYGIMGGELFLDGVESIQLKDFRIV